MWQSPDPILVGIIEGEPNGGMFNPKNLNLYSYTYQNPVFLKDPDGRSPAAACLVWPWGTAGCAIVAVGAAITGYEVADTTIQVIEGEMSFEQAAQKTAVDVATGVALGGIGKAVAKFGGPLVRQVANSRWFGRSASTLTPESGADAIAWFRRNNDITDSSGGKGVVAVTEIDGKQIFGLNGANYTDEAKAINNQLRAELGMTGARGQSLLHAEGDALIRAYQANGGKLPSTMSMSVDKRVCNICRGELPRLMNRLGVDELTIHGPNETIILRSVSD